MEGKCAHEGVNEIERRKKRLDRLPCQTTVDLDVSGMEIGLVMYTIWAKGSGTDGIEVGEQEERGAALLLLVYCRYEASLMCLRNYHCCDRAKLCMKGRSH